MLFRSKDSVAVIRNSDGYGLWTKESAAMEKVPYIDLNKLIADKLDKMGKMLFKHYIMVIILIHQKRELY